MILSKLLKKYITVALSFLTLLPSLALYTGDDYKSHQDYQSTLAKMDFALPEGTLIASDWVLTSADRANKLDGTITLCKITPNSIQCPIEKKIPYDYIVYSKSFSPLNNPNNKLALIHLSEPITTITPAKRIRSLKYGETEVYLCSYNQDSTDSNVHTKVLGTSQVYYCGPGIPYQLRYVNGRTIFEAKIDNDNPYDNGSGLYIKDFYTQELILAGVFETNNKEQCDAFQASSILDFNKWIDHTILKFALEGFNKNKKILNSKESKFLTQSYQDFLDNLVSPQIELTSEKLCGVAIDSNTVITAKTNVRPQDIRIKNDLYPISDRIVIDSSGFQILHLQKPIKDSKVIQKRLRAPLEYFLKGFIFNKDNKVFWVQNKSYLPDQYCKLKGTELPSRSIRKLKIDFDVKNGTGLYAKCPNNSSLLAGLIVQNQVVLFSPELNAKIDQAILNLNNRSQYTVALTRSLPTPTIHPPKVTLRAKAFINRSTKDLYEKHLSDQYTKLTFKEFLKQKRNIALFVSYCKDIVNKLDPDKTYTFFIPTNNAIAKLKHNILEKLDQDENARNEFINCHIKENAVLPPFDTALIHHTNGTTYKSVNLNTIHFPDLKFIYDINGINANQLLLYSNQEKFTIKIIDKGFIIGENIIYLIDTPLISKSTLNFLINEESLDVKRQQLLKKHAKPLIVKPNAMDDNVQTKENYLKSLLNILEKNVECKIFYNLISKAELSNFLLRNPEEPIFLIVPNNDILTKLETDLGIDFNKMSPDNLCYFIKHFIIPFSNKIESIKTDLKSHTLKFFTTNIKKTRMATIEEEVPIKKGMSFLTESGDQLYFNDNFHYGLQLNRFNSEILKSYYSTILKKGFYKSLPKEIGNSYKTITPPPFDQIISCSNGTMLILRNPYCINGETAITSPFFTENIKARFSDKYAYSPKVNLVNELTNNPTIPKPQTKVKQPIKTTELTLLDHLENDPFFKSNILLHKDLKTNHTLEDLLGDNAITNFVLLLPNNSPLPQISTKKLAFNQLDIYNDFYYDFKTFDKNQTLDFLKMHLLKLSDKMQKKLITGDYSSVFDNFLTAEDSFETRNIHLNLDDVNNQTMSYIDAYGDYHVFEIDKLIKCKNGFVCSIKGRILPYNECKKYFTLKKNINNHIRNCRNNLQHLENDELTSQIIQDINTKINSKELAIQLKNNEFVKLTLTHDIAEKNYDGSNDDFLITLNKKIIKEYRLNENKFLHINIDKNNLELQIQNEDVDSDIEDDKETFRDSSTSSISSSSSNVLIKPSTPEISGDCWTNHPMLNKDEEAKSFEDENNSDEWKD